MTDFNRKRQSKWDVAVEMNLDDVMNENRTSNADECSNDRTSNMDWTSLCDGSELVNSPGIQSNNALETKHSPEVQEINDQNVPSVRHQSPKQTGIDMAHKVLRKESVTSCEPFPIDQVKGKHDVIGSVADSGKITRTNLLQIANTSKEKNRSRSPIKEQRRRSRSRGRDRSRSRSRSWSRSRRSRSPRVGATYGEARRVSRDRVEPRRPLETCRNFAAGRCRKGSECRYLHNERRRSSYRTSERDMDSRDRGGYLHSADRDIQENRDYSQDKIRKSQGSHYHSDHMEPEVHRNSVPLQRCYYFSNGRCQRGAICRFAHHNASSSGGQGRHEDGVEVLCQSLRKDDVDNDSYPEYGSIIRHKNQVTGMEGSQNTHSFQDENPAKDSTVQPCHGVECTTLTVSEKLVASASKVPSLMLPVAAPLPLQGHGTVSNFPIEQVVSLFPSSRSMEQITYLQSQGGQNLLIALQAPQSSSNLDTGTPSRVLLSAPDVQSSFPCANNAQTALPRGNVVSLGILGDSGHSWQSIPIPLNVSSQQAIGQTGQSQYPICTVDVQNKKTGPSLQSGQNEQIHKLNGQLHHTSWHSPYAFPQPSSNAQMNLNINKDVKLTGLDYSRQALTSQSNMEVGCTPKAVTSHQAAQISNLSASLAHFFRNGQNLPQILASLTPQGSTGPSVTLPLPIVGSTIPSVSQEQNNDLPNKSEVAKQETSNHLHGLPPSSTKQKDPRLENLRDTSKGSPSDAAKVAELEKRPSPEVPESKKVEVTCDNGLKKENETDKEHTAQLEAEPEIPPNGENKKNKDPKGIRMFKCALVELVKEMLKPNWREGNLSKEAHKTIVKKVVDKVTSSIQAPSIPQTPEKIDLYLSHSKPKLIKLVQAYVEKHS